MRASTLQKLSTVMSFCIFSSGAALLIIALYFHYTPYHNFFLRD